MQVWHQCYITRFWSGRLIKISRRLPKNVLQCHSFSTSLTIFWSSELVTSSEERSWSWQKRWNKRNGSPLTFGFLFRNKSVISGIAKFFLKALPWILYQHRPPLHTSTQEIIQILQVLLICLTYISEYGVNGPILKT